MIKMFFHRVQEIEEVEKAAGVKYINFPDDVFELLRREFDLNNDEYFLKYLREIDLCDVPLPNVARDLLTGQTHSFDKVSTGVRVLWLMARFPDRFLYPTQWLGENCYQAMFDLGEMRDIFIYEDSDIFDEEEMEECTGSFEDMHTGKVVKVDCDNGYEYITEMNY